MKNFITGIAALFLYIAVIGIQLAIAFAIGKFFYELIF